MASGVLTAARLRAGFVALVATLVSLAIIPSLASAANITPTGTESYNANSPYAGLVISQFDPDVSTSSTSSTFTNSFIQLLNGGSKPVELQGLSLQDFGGTALTTDQWGSTAGGDVGPIALAPSATPPTGGCATTSGPVAQTGCLQPGQYYLLESSLAVTGSEDLPVADQSYQQGFGGTAPETAAATATTEGAGVSASLTASTAGDAYLFLVDGTADIGSDIAPQLGGAGQSTGIVDAVATNVVSTPVDSGKYVNYAYTAPSGAPLFGTSTGDASTIASGLSLGTSTASGTSPLTLLYQRNDGGCTDTGANQSDWTIVTAVNGVPSNFQGVLSDSASPYLPCADAATQVAITAAPAQVEPGQPFTVKVADETAPSGGSSAGTVIAGDSTGTAQLTATADLMPVTLSCVDANNTSVTNGSAAFVQGYATFTCTVPSGTSGELALNATGTTSNSGESYFTPVALLGATATATVVASEPAVIAGAGTVGSGLVIDTLDVHGGDGDPGYGFDFVDLFNGGTNPVSLSGLSVQYVQLSTEPIDDNPTLPCAYGWTGYITVSGSTCKTSGTAQAAGKVEWTEPLPDVVVQPGQSFLAAITGQNAPGTDPESQDLAPLPFAPDVAWNPTGYSSNGARIQVANNLIALVDGTTAEGTTVAGTTTASTLNATGTPTEPVIDSYTNFGENAGVTESYYDPGVTYIRGEVGSYIDGAARVPYRLDGGCQNSNDNEQDFNVVPPLAAVADGSDSGDMVAYAPQNQMTDMSGVVAPCGAPTQLAFTTEPPSSTAPTSSMPDAFTVQVSSETAAGVVAGQDNSTTVTLGITPDSGVSGANLTCINANAPYSYNSAGTLVPNPAPTVEQELDGTNGLTGTQVTDNGNGTVSLHLVGGQATLDCSVDTAGSGYTLTVDGTSATYGALTPAVSNQFAVATPTDSGFSATDTQGLVISEVDNGGGEWYADESHPMDLNNWHNGFVELFNSSDHPVSLNGLSTQFFDESTATSTTGVGYTGCGATPSSCAAADLVPNDLQANDQYEDSDGGGFPTAFPLRDVTLAPGQHYLIEGINNFESIEDGGYQNATSGTPPVPDNGGTYPAAAFGEQQYDLPAPSFEPWAPSDQNAIRFEDSPEEGSDWLLVDGTTPMASVDLENPPTANILSDQTFTSPTLTGPSSNQPISVDQPVVDSMTQAGEDGRVVPGVTYSTGFPAPAQTTNGADEGYAYSRVDEGCQDTQNNALDFAELWSTSVTPENLTSPLVSCSAVEAAQNSVQPGLVIAGAYGGGGQTNSYYANDFVEIENAGQNPISLVGDSLQYYGPSGPSSPATDNTPAGAADDPQQVNLVPNATDSAGQCSSSTTGPVSQTGCLQPGQYYLVQGAGAGEGDGQPISPVPDQTDPNFAINWSAASDDQSKGGPGCPGDGVSGALVCDAGGILVVANTTDAITQPQIDGTDTPSGPVIDGLGVGAPLWSIGSPISVPNDADGDFRNKNGCADTNNNSGDFTEGNAQHATLYNSNSAYVPCPANTGGTPIYAFGYTPSPSTSATPPVVNGETENPAGIAIGSNGTTYLADTLANTVLTLPYPTSSALATTFAGSFEANGDTGDNGAATSATLSRPNGLAVDSQGNVFIADTDNNVIREVSENGATTGDITTVAGNGTAGYSGDGGQATAAKLNRPIGIAVTGSGANETLYIADSLNDVIRAVNLSTGVITTVAGTPGQAGYAGDGSAATNALLNEPDGVAVDSQGNLFIADSGNNVIREVSENGGNSGEIITVAGDYAAYAAAGYQPADSGNGGPATSAQLDDPQAITVDPAGDIFIADTYNNAIREVSAATGTISVVSADPPTDPEGLAIDPSTGDLLVASAGSSQVTLISGGIQEGTGAAAGEAPANQLVLSGAPSGSVASGSSFTVQVSEQSQAGSADTTDSSTNVALTLLSPANQTPGALNCTSGNSAQLNNGVASFACTVTGPGSGYELEATASGNESPAESAPFAIAYPVDQPSGVSAQSSNESATVNWTAVSGATGYDIYAATASGAELASNPNDATTPSGEVANQPVATVSGANASTSTITGLDDGQAYDFIVQAQSPSGSSLPSQEVDATPVAVPGVLGATAGDQSATISWSQSEGATGYTVLVSSTSGHEQTSVINGCTAAGQSTTSCTVNNLTNGSEYYFIVEATNSTGTSGASLEVNATPSTVPDAPAGVVGTAASGKLTVSWSPAGDEGSAITGYSVYASTTSGGENTSGTPACTTSASGQSAPADSCVISGLTNGTPEYFVVVATNADGNSAPSTEATQTPSTIPDAPTAVSTSAGNGEVQVSWTAPADDGGSPLTGYAVYDASAAGGEQALSAPACTASSADTSCTVTGLTPGLDYFFVVVASNTDGSSAFSSEVSATPTLDPNAPTSVTAIGGSEQVALSWTAPTNPVSGYSVYEATASAAENLSGTPVCAAVTGTSCAVSGLTDGTTYYFVVVASLSGGGTAESGQTSATPVAAPTGLTATAGNHEATLSWSAAVGATGYEVFSSTTNGGEVLSGAAACTSTGTTCTVSNLTDGTKYYFKVVGTNPGGISAGSVQASTTPLAVPSAPGGVAVTPGNGSLTVSWSAPSSTGGATVTGYDVYVSTARGAENISGAPACSTTAATRCELSGLQNGQTYYVVVVAQSAFGPSTESAEASGTPSTVPNAPSGVTITAGADSATVSWSAPAFNGGSPVTGYEVFTSTTKGGERLSGAPTCSTSGAGCSVSGLVPGTAYYFVVVATNVNGLSVASSEVGLTAEPAAGAVARLTATAGNGSADVSWAAPPRGSASRYSVYVSTSRRMSTTGKPACTTTKTSCKITGLKNGTTYYLVVVTKGLFGTQATSDTVSVVPGASAKPGTPGKPDAQVGKTPAHETLPGGADSTTVTEFDTHLRAGTKLTVRVTEPDHKRPISAVVKVLSDHAYQYRSGKLPVGETTIRFYETVGKHLKLISTEHVTVTRKP